MKKLLLLVCAVSLFSCTKKCPPPLTLKSEMANTTWHPLGGQPYDLKLTKDTAYFIQPASSLIYSYIVSNDTLTFYDDEDTIRYKFSIYNHLMTTTNIPFDGNAAQFRQIN